MATEPNQIQETWDPTDIRFAGIIDWKNLGELPEGWRLPTHLDLPDSDGRPVDDFAQQPSGHLISQSLKPLLEKRHPDKQYCIGQNSGIYWRRTQPPLDGVIVPDWFYVADVPPMLEGEYRRSYVMWQEQKAPFLVLEFVSGSGEKERDDTPAEGKFWIYERVVQAEYYGIFDPRTETLELYHLENGRYRRVPEIDHGRCPIPELHVELGIWEGEYNNQYAPWLRVWDLGGEIRPHFEEMTEHALQQIEEEKQRRKQALDRAKKEKQRAEQEKQRAEQEKQRAEQEKQRADKLAEQLRKMGLDPENL